MFTMLPVPIAGIMLLIGQQSGNIMGAVSSHSRDNASNWSEALFSEGVLLLIGKFSFPQAPCRDSPGSLPEMHRSIVLSQSTPNDNTMLQFMTEQHIFYSSWH